MAKNKNENRAENKNENRSTNKTNNEIGNKMGTPTQNISDEAFRNGKQYSEENKKKNSIKD